MYSTHPHSHQLTEPPHSPAVSPGSESLFVWTQSPPGVASQERRVSNKFPHLPSVFVQYSHVKPSKEAKCLMPYTVSCESMCEVYNFWSNWLLVDNPSD